MTIRWLVFCVMVCLLAQPGFGAEKEKKPARPVVLLTRPLGLKAGAKTRLVIRGKELDKATAVDFAYESVSVKFVKASKAGSPEAKLKQRLGETQVIVEVTVDSKVAPKEVSFKVKGPNGESEPHAIWIDKPGRIVKEKETNGGFKQAQQVELPVTVDGSIGKRQDVDVFAFAGKAGDKVSVVLLGASRGSVLDGLLSVYDEEGNLVAARFEGKRSADPRIEVVLPRNGTFYVSVMDGHDFGTPFHLYRLRIAKER